MSDRTQRVRWRKTPKPELDHSVPSPCIRVCKLDSESGLCEGCYRNMDEIREWMILSREEKLAVLDNIRQRQVAG